MRPERLHLQANQYQSPQWRGFGAIIIIISNDMITTKPNQTKPSDATSGKAVIQQEPLLKHTVPDHGCTQSNAENKVSITKSDFFIVNTHNMHAAVRCLTLMLKRRFESAMVQSYPTTNDVNKRSQP
jgi:hypothetical protein